MKRIFNYLLSKQWILNIVIQFISEEKKKRIYIAQLRSELAYWTHNIYKRTDEEIIADIHIGNQVISKFGVTTGELSAILKEMSRQFSNTKESIGHV